MVPMWVAGSAQALTQPTHLPTHHWFSFYLFFFFSGEREGFLKSFINIYRVTNKRIITIHGIFIKVFNQKMTKMRVKRKPCQFGHCCFD
jgi:hypothetical protein